MGGMPGRHRVARSLVLAATIGALTSVGPGWSAAHATTAQPAQPARADKPVHKPPKKPSNKPAIKTAAKAEAEPLYAGREEIRAFASDVAARRGLDAAWIEGQLALARLQLSVQRFIMPPPAGTAKNWAAYRDRFVEPRRIQAGAAFWQEHAAWLQRAEERWGVPAQIVVGIIGIETFYGRHLGSFRTLDALATLAFDFPPGRRDRSDFFRSELEEFFVLSDREGSDPQAARSSFAGAMGLPQFMPGSVNRYAVDFDGDGHIDLQDSVADAIGSVAHYLAAFGWQRGQPTHYGVAVPVDLADRAVLLGPDIVPSFSAAQFAERGAVLDEAGRRHDGLLALVMLENGNAAPTHIAGTANFYAITRYNWSSYYALAVITLGEAVQRQRESVPRS
jgi:membrane-bound lytic murein transglycosylase B